jgi:hypothetical protein
MSDSMRKLKRGEKLRKSIMQPEHCWSLPVTLGKNSSLRHCMTFVRIFLMPVWRLLYKNSMLKCQLSEYRFNEESFENNTDKVKYFTGLPNYSVLMPLFDLVKEHIPKPRHNTDLGKFEGLMRLKLNMPVQYLAFRFRTSTATVSKTFLVIIHKKLASALGTHINCKLGHETAENTDNYIKIFEIYPIFK